jgi:mannose-6-phosphate isomerase-like protein (cupin superfamily)
MKYLFRLVLALLVTPALVSAQNPAAARPAAPAAPVTNATVIDHARVAETLAKGGNLVSASDVVVLGAHRGSAGQVEVHDHEMDVFYIVDGSATFVTGGKIVGAKNTRPGQWLGTSIVGGTTHALVKGDVVVVPARMPHWFKEVPTEVSYFVVKVIKP